ncbi:hypothetical protein ACFORG_22190 [Lutimaribacter marinistellae]|uniref:HEAT repeat domain-containing protein n=1 Tax=Lutimaribacter marinistellae TaxID=1820329 RepID=A0ABV7TQ86_9RHOB
MNASLRALLPPVAALFLAAPALACTVCLERPEKTLADRVLNGDGVVIAREDPEDPFHYRPVSIIHGTVAGVDIPFLVDSTTRRRLSSNPENGVLMVREGQIWTRAGFADAEWREVVGRIIASRDEWDNNPEARFAYFEELLHGQNAFLRHIAVDELSRAPYGQIRSMREPIPGQVARQALSDKSLLPWRGFFILMLGMSTEPDHHEIVRERMATAKRYSLGKEFEPWATAFVEVDGAHAVEWLISGWFEAPGASTQELRAVTAALTAHARYGDPALREEILDALGALPRQRPDVVGTVATALAEIGDFSRGEAIRLAVRRDTLRRTGVEIAPEELFAASSYVYRARQANKTRALEQQESEG